LQIPYSSQALQKKPSAKASFYSTETTPKTATMASFNFDKFDTEFEMKQMLRNVTEALNALRNPANVNERLVPLEPGTPLQRLMAPASPAIILCASTVQLVWVAETDGLPEASPPCWCDRKTCSVTSLHLGPAYILDFCVSPLHVTCSPLLQKFDFDSTLYVQLAPKI
jgi:hypothetical protein